MSPVRILLHGEPCHHAQNPAEFLHVFTEAEGDCNLIWSSKYSNTTAVQRNINFVVLFYVLVPLQVITNIVLVFF